MRSPKKKATAAELRNWRISILRNRAEYLGTVEAADAAAAEALAARRRSSSTVSGASALPCEPRNDRSSLLPLLQHRLGLRGAHDDRPWDGPHACGCGAPGAPCPTCDPADRDHPPRLPAGFVPDDEGQDK
jgi:hypothetical protein